jgi:hypothetical protein
VIGGLDGKRGETFEKEHRHRCRSRFCQNGRDGQFPNGAPYRRGPLAAPSRLNARMTRARSAGERVKHRANRYAASRCGNTSSWKVRNGAPYHPLRRLHTIFTASPAFTNAIRLAARAIYPLNWRWHRELRLPRQFGTIGGGTTVLKGAFASRLQIRGLQDITTMSQWRKTVW